LLGRRHWSSRLRGLGLLVKTGVDGVLAAYAIEPA
jgi:hypothetical protein